MHTHIYECINIDFLSFIDFRVALIKIPPLAEVTKLECIMYVMPSIHIISIVF